MRLSSRPLPDLLFCDYGLYVLKRVLQTTRHLDQEEVVRHQGTSGP